MSLIKCSECGSDTSNKALSCPKCGCPTEKINDMIPLPSSPGISVLSKKKKNIAFSLVLILLIGGGLVWWNSRTCDIEVTKEFSESMQKYGNIFNGFSEGLIIVTRNGKCGFIDKHGKEIIPCKYDDAYNFSEGLAVVCKDNKYGAIDKSGNEIIPCKYNVGGARVFTEGLLIIGRDNKWGFIDKQGNEVIPCKYDNASNFSEGLAVVGYMQANYSGMLYGAIDKFGNEIIPCEYEITYNFSEGLLAIRKDDRSGFIDKNGKEVISCKYDDAYNFSEGLAVVKRDEKYGVIDKNGNEVIPYKYDGAVMFSEGLLAVSEYDGTEVAVQGFGIAKNSKYGFVDKHGREVVPCIYGYTYKFSEGLAMVSKDGKCGFIDKHGNEVIPFKYEDAESSGFSNGLARVKYKGKWGLVDKKGNDTFRANDTDDISQEKNQVPNINHKDRIVELSCNSVSVSNTLKNQASNNYNSTNLLDNDLATAWATHFIGNGNEYVSFNLNTKKLNKIVIMNGYRKSDNSYENNSRAKSIEVQADGNFVWSGTIEDNYAPQIILLNIGYVANITITIHSVYEGRKWNDLCLSEIKFYGVK